MYQAVSKLLILLSRCVKEKLKRTAADLRKFTIFEVE